MEHFSYTIKNQNMSVPLCGYCTPALRTLQLHFFIYPTFVLPRNTFFFTWPCYFHFCTQSLFISFSFPPTSFSNAVFPNGKGKLLRRPFKVSPKPPRTWHLSACTGRGPNISPAAGLPSRSIMANCTTAAGSERTGDWCSIKFMKKTGIFLKAGVTKRSWRWYNSIPQLWKILTSSGWKHTTEPDI